MKPRRPAAGQRRPASQQRPPVAFLSRSWTPWAVIFCAALAIRIAYVAGIDDAVFVRQLQVESERYHRWAQLILAGHAPRPPFEQAPGYPYLLAIVYSVTGAVAANALWVQAFLDAGTCVLIAALGHRAFGRRVGWFAGALAVVYGPFIAFAGELLPEASLTLVATAAACLAAGAAPAWGLAGALWAVAIVVRTNALFALPVVALDAILRGGWNAALRSCLPVVLIVAAFAAVNAASAPHSVLLTTSGGVNLWLGNNPDSDGVNPFISAPLRPFAARVRQTASDAAEADDMFRAEAARFFREQPGAALALVWKKLVWSFSNRELPNTGDIDWRTRHSWLFRLPVLPLSFGLVLPLALAGVVLLGADWGRAGPLAALLAIGVGTTVVFFTNARFRLILVPPLLVLAGVALDRGAASLRAWRREPTRLVAAVAAAVIGLVVAWGDFYGVREYQIAEIDVNTGALEREAGNFDSAVFYLRRGLAATPDDGVAWVHLALALEQSGDTGSAASAYLDGLVQARGGDDLQGMAGRFWQRHGIDPSLARAYVDASDEQERAAIAKRVGEQVGRAPGE